MPEKPDANPTVSGRLRCVRAEIPSSLPALVTGASSGLGSEFAAQLAERGHDVTLVARRTDRLRTLARELEKRHGTAITPVTADLETSRGRDRAAALLADGRAWILVNNAGFGSRGSLADLPLDRERAQVLVNVVALHHLAGAALPGQVAAGQGGILNVASTAAFQPLPGMATYSATKAFVLTFTEALAVEARGTGVRVTCLCPGPVRTEFHAVAGTGREIQIAPTLEPADCVRAALRAFDRNQTICIPGAINALIAASARLAPRSATRHIAGRILARRPS